ncbi:MAG: transporter [Mycobacterium sp.]|nr:transporter [Mycobacterium sp.]
MSIESVASRTVYASATVVWLALVITGVALAEAAVSLITRWLSSTIGDLHGISFTAEPGQMISLVGSSGVGKSTTASLLARLADVDSDMPDGLDTVVGERGYRLSGAQRQRLIIARLLLGKSWVVVLDEATASLDSASEAAVQQALAEALAGRTSIVIAHQLSTIRAADAILVVEDGRSVERGTHEQLLVRGGRYAELCETPFGEDAVAA